jgi:hypothetical protein
LKKKFKGKKKPRRKAVLTAFEENDDPFENTSSL